MKWQLYRDECRDVIGMRLEIDGSEYMRASLTSFDHALIQDCETSDKLSDRLLALETIVRRIEESAPYGDQQ